MTRNLPSNSKLFVLILLIIAGITEPSFSQAKISGIINNYGQVTAIGSNYVIVEDDTQFSQFSEGDTILLIQMKGARIYTAESGSFGVPYQTYGPAGMHEFLTVLSVDPATNTITFRNNIAHPSFNIYSGVQIVKVPSYNWAEVTGTLTCQPWDSTFKTGGVLVAIVGRTLSLKANIDVSGKGLKGGIIDAGLGVCVMDNIPIYDRFAFPSDADNSGYKGEGLAVRGDDGTLPYPAIFPLYAKGKGAIFTGGGGGNGKFSGGGGGAGYGDGGSGGRESPFPCTSPYGGGQGGEQISGSGLDGGIFLGGGGGASTYNGSLTATPGGNGGGIVILMCDTLKGNNFSILAEGGSAAQASGDAGAGGGGGGGSVAVYLQSYTSLSATAKITLSVKGGNGGGHQSTYGEGGGGGGGLINTNNISPVIASDVTKTVAGGSRGFRTGIITATNGSAGRNSTAFAPFLNGFLFNSIRSSYSGTQTDTICSDVVPYPITGTTPVGGSGDYSFIWQKSLDSTLWNTIPGVLTRDYIPSDPEPDTFWVRRIITDNLNALLRDTSTSVKIVVQPAITGNLIGKDTTICYNQNPLSIIPLNAGPSNGNKVDYLYQWKQNYEDLNWTTAPVASGSVSTLASFDPPSLTATTYYMRVVTSGYCVSYSPAVLIDVLPLITNNLLIRPDSVICEGMDFNIIGGTVTDGGSGSYAYQWQDSTAAGEWLQASGTVTNLAYIPDTSDFKITEQRYFRRVVYSGPDSVCRNESTPIQLTRYHKIGNNIISNPDNMICAGDTPLPLTGTDPVNGNGTYTYQWQDSASVTWTTRYTLNSPYMPASLADTTWYRRIVNSSVCSDTSDVFVINVHDPVINFNISNDTTICSNAIPSTLKGQSASGGNGSFAYQWFYSTDNFVTSKIAVPVTGTLEDFSPTALTQDTWYMREVISGECFEVSNIVKVTVHPLISNNVIIPAKPSVCFNSVPDPISGSLPSGGSGAYIYQWQDSTAGGIWKNAAGGSASQQSYTPQALTEKTWFRRIVKSGIADCCQDTSDFQSIDINLLPTGSIITLNDTTICNGEEVILKVHLEGAPAWTVIYNENSTAITASGISSSEAVISRVPVATAGMSVFNYSLVSVQDQNGCFATLLSGGRRATVYRLPVPDAGPDDAVCGPGYKLNAVTSDGNGSWIFPPQVLDYEADNPESAIKIDSSFSAASVEYTFYWKEENWQCADSDAVVVTFFHRIDTINAGRDTTIMSFDNVTRLNALPVKSFETGLWSMVSGTGDFDNPSSNTSGVKNMSSGLNTYKWSVRNGECLLEDLINIEVTNVIIPQGLSPDGDGVNDEMTITGLNPEWQYADLSIVSGAGVEVFNVSNRDGSQWQNWDGKNFRGAELPEGTYYYLLKITSRVTGKVVMKSGFIILKRS